MKATTWITVNLQKSLLNFKLLSRLYSIMHMMNWPYKICIFQNFHWIIHFSPKKTFQSQPQHERQEQQQFFSLIICYYPAMQIKILPQHTRQAIVLTAVKFHHLTSLSVHQLQSSSVVVACTQHGAYQHFVISPPHLEFNLIIALWKVNDTSPCALNDLLTIISWVAVRNGMGSDGNMQKRHSHLIFRHFLRHNSLNTLRLGW